MKKSVFFALAALSLAACTKDAATAVSQLTRPTHTVTISAGIDQGSKTAYDEQGKFSWSAGDVIGVVYLDPEENIVTIPFSTTDSGPVADFTGEVPDGYGLPKMATYPFNTPTDGYACNDFAWNEKNFRLWGSIKPDMQDPLSMMPLTGVMDDDGFFIFRSAAGAVKFTVVNMPMETYFTYLETPAESGAYLNGWFALDESGVIKMENASEGYLERYNWNVPTEANKTMDVYFFLPVGTLPAGTKFEICDNSWGAIHSFVFQKDVEVVRNAVTEIAPITIESIVYEKGAEIPLKENMIYASDVCSHDGQGVIGLIDNDPATYWHSNWYYAVQANDPLYGVWFDFTIALPIDSFQFKYQVRDSNANSKPTKIVYGVSEDGVTWKQAGEVANDQMSAAAAGEWVELPAVSLDGSYRFIRLGIADSNDTGNGSLTGNLSFEGGKKCVNMAELKLFLPE